MCHSEHDIIIQMHERGFEQDFQLLGNDLLWLQEKIFIRCGDFHLLECHCTARLGSQSGALIMGIYCHSYQLKGILLIHEGDWRLKAPVLLKKIREWRYNAGLSPDHQDLQENEIKILQFF